MKNIFTNHFYLKIIEAFIGLLVIFAALAGWRYSEMPHRAQHGVQPEESLQNVASEFTASQKKLLHRSKKLANRLRSELSQNSSTKQLFASLKAYSQLWGAVLYEGKEPLVWKGFSLILPEGGPKPGEKTTQIKIVKDNNVTYWLVRIDFDVSGYQGEKTYHLFTAKRISQHNALAIGKSKSYSMLSSTPGSAIFNKTINIGEPLPDQYIGYKTLYSLSGDSVGVVVATARGFQQVKAHWKRVNHFWRSAFVLLCLVVIGVFLFIILDRLKAWQALIFQTVLLGIVWYIFYRVDIAQNWLPFLIKGMRPEVMASYQDLCSLFIDSVFFLFFTYTLKEKFKRFHFQFDSNSFFYEIVAAFFVGILNAVAVTFVFRSCYQLIYHSTIPILTLHIIPGTGTLLFYLSIGVLFLALTNLVRYFNQLLLYTCENLTKMVSAVTFFAFLLGMFLLSAFAVARPYFGWVFIISLIYFSIVFLLSLISFSRPFSPLRTAAIYSFIIALAGATVIYQASTNHLDVELEKVVHKFTTNKDKQAEYLTRTLLNNFLDYYQLFQGLSTENQLTYLQAQIPSIVKATMRDNKELYFYDIQLRNDQDSVLLNFSNNLNTPLWMHQFTSDRLNIVVQLQGITPLGNRPVIQHPKLQEADKYQVFYRGWIPLFSPGEHDPIGWVLCSIYRDYPNFSKPLRAVINQKHYGAGRQSFLVQLFKNGRLYQKNYLGFRARYPVHTVLTTAERQAINRKHVIFYTSHSGGVTYRNILKKRPQNRTIKASVIVPGYQHILFLYFQLSITLLVVGFLLTIVVRWVENREFSLFGTDDRFQYRILDSFLLATLVFLVLLICITWLASSHKNKKLVEQQLFKKLTTLSTTVEKKPAGAQNQNLTGTVSLDSLASELNVDALFYHKRLLTNSTTPQLYRQNLLPKVMPFPVYRDLYLQREKQAFSMVKLNDQKMILGYRSVKYAGGKPVASIAIPTFIKSPFYGRQLLQTTSYLIILYIIIFGVFIIGTVFITRRLTKPLDHIRRGLHEISRGELNTTIPVTSEDEIGNLAKVYNEMVERLRELREELAATERENAWQEMAQQVAHEIKNPLTPMKLNVQYLQRQLADGELTIEELTERISEVTQNLTQQIDSLSNIASDFSQFSEPLKPEEFNKVDVNDLVQEVAGLYKHDSHLDIKVKSDAQQSCVMGVGDELKRVLVNLMKNAQESLTHDGIIKLKTYNRGENIFIEVEDNGRGIAEEDKSKIFVPNFSTKSSGTGLGLAICRKVIEAHKGSMSFASIKGEGTTFVIKLPLENSGG